jgi:hypothetical protein
VKQGKFLAAKLLHSTVKNQKQVQTQPQKNQKESGLVSAKQEINQTNDKVRERKINNK